MMKEFLCHKCGAPWQKGEQRQPGFKESCSQCGAYLHCCRNCRFHRPSAHNQCYIPNTEHVGNREGLNFCEEFEFRSAAESGHEETEKKQQARDQFQSLFKEDAETEKPITFEDLFKQ